jgi:hypothetical protein
MGKRLAILPLFLVAFLVLAVSIFRTASVKYVFSQAPSPVPETPEIASIDYALPEPELTPESPLWPVKALLDMGEQSPQEHLKNADIRLVAGLRMFEGGKVEEAILVLEKAELHLKRSLDAAVETGDLPESGEILYTISVASLKHREVLETILPRMPEDGKAVITKILDIPKTVYNGSSSELVKAGLIAPEYPF